MEQNSSKQTSIIQKMHEEHLGEITDSKTKANEEISKL